MKSSSPKTDQIAVETKSLTMREQPPMNPGSNDTSSLTRTLAEPETLETAGWRRSFAWHIPIAATAGPAADEVRRLLDSPSPARRSALALTLGYELDPRRLSFD